MFEMKPAERLVKGADTEAMVDTVRDAALQWIGGMGMVPGALLVLTWGGRVIPFSIYVEAFPTTAECPEYTVFQFKSFGGDNHTAAKGMPAYIFHDAAERAEAQLLAVEALLAWGGNCRGAEQPDGRKRVEFQGRTWTLSDFGMG